MSAWTGIASSPARAAAAEPDVPPPLLRHRLAAREPAVVVAGHMTPTAAADSSAITHTRAWLLAFEEELAKAADAVALNAAMKARFPSLGMEVAIDIGAKVATGEMKWG